MQEKCLNIAIIGASGVGKSSFINAIRGLTADDEGSAHVDIIEATTEVTPYFYPKNKNIVFWDFPGLGTPKFSREKYFRMLTFRHYDFFLILSAGRFRDDDLLLASKVKKQRKDFFFVRTQIDVDVSKDRKAHPRTHDKRHVIKKIRGDCLQNLAAHGFVDSPVFLIDSYNTTEWNYDFEKLETFLISKVEF